MYFLITSNEKIRLSGVPHVKYIGLDSSATAEIKVYTKCENRPLSKTQFSAKFSSSTSRSLGNIRYFR